MNKGLIVFIIFTYAAISEHEFDITNLSSAEIKSKIQRDGIWPQYTQRIKTLKRAEKELWILFEQENDSTEVHCQSMSFKVPERCLGILILFCLDCFFVMIFVK